MWHVESVESVVCVHEWKSAVVRCLCGAATQTKQQIKPSSSCLRQEGVRDTELRRVFESWSDTRSPGVPVLLSKSGVPHSAAHSLSPPTSSKKSKQKQSERVVTLLLSNSSTKATLAWLTGIRQKRLEFVCLYNLQICLCEHKGFCNWTRLTGICDYKGL